MIPKTQTALLQDALLARLQEHFKGELSVELFPEAPGNYRLNHPRGAILVAYGRSKFGDSEATDAVFQERQLVFRLTLVFKQLNGKDGVTSYLDRIREHLAGWYPPHCDRPCQPVSEQFLGHVQGVWQYALDVSTRATQVQVVVPSAGPFLASADFEHEDFQ
ncbi:Gp37 family protein [Pseudomonas huaxiensis]|uniref:Gp37 family protein n=1 Tax=Pseudomonas huaxiensis TaxID=2213017 RepID=UPI000DA6948C|nr:Gp37 family protein [Pseudomonas huaxiensis]